MIVHTHALELLLEVSHVFAVGNAEVVVGIIRLRDAVGGRGSAEGENGGGAMGALGVADFLDCHHWRCEEEEEKRIQKRERRMKGE